MRHGQLVLDLCLNKCSFRGFCNAPKTTLNNFSFNIVSRQQRIRPLTNCACESPRRLFFTIPGVTSSRKKEYIGKKIVGFTPDEMFQVVSDVENYRSFVPFCIRSDVSTRTEKLLLGRLEVGFPPLIESYVSKVTLIPPRLVKADCTDGKLFDHLVTIWRFNDGPKQNPRSTTIYFYLSFEFKSALHSQLANLFFNQLVQQMEQAFILEAEKRFGTPSIRTIHLAPPSS